MAVRIVEGKLPYSAGTGINITANKVIEILLRSENNLIEVDDNNELYVDLQLASGITPTDDFPVGVTVGQVLSSDGWITSGTILNFQTTSGDYGRWLYGTDGHMYYDHGTGTFTQIYSSTEVDALFTQLRSELATVAFTGDYNDLLNRPVIPVIGDGTLTINQNNISKGTFTANQVGPSTIDLTDTTYPNMTAGEVGTGTDTTPMVISPKVLSDYVLGKVSSVYKYQGSVQDYDHLPTQNLTIGDVYNVIDAHTTAPVFDAGTNVAWTGTARDPLGGNVDLSNYVTINGNETITGTKTFTIDPVLPSKTTDATNTGTSPATEAQVYKKQDTLTAGDNIDITGNTISADDMKADVQSFTSKYQMTQWDTAKKGDVAKVQNTGTSTIIFNGSTTVLNGVEGGLQDFVAYGYIENVSPLPDGYVQYDKVSGNATISTGLSGDLATYIISGDQGTFKLRQDGVLVFNAVPCKNTSNVVGFYDLVSNGFFTPSATLTAGDEVTGPTPEVPRPIMTNNGILKYNKQTSEWYTEGDVETIKISYLG